MVREVRVCWDALPDDFRRGDPFPPAAHPQRNGKQRSSVALKSVACGARRQVQQREKAQQSTDAAGAQRPQNVDEHLHHPDRAGAPDIRREERRQSVHPFPANRWSQLTSLPPSDRPRKQVSLFVCPEWWVLLRAEAARQGIPLSELCRRWLLPQVEALSQYQAQQLSHESASEEPL